MRWKQLALLSLVGGVAGVAWWAWQEHQRMLEERREKDYWERLDDELCGCEIGGEK